eukprot:GGOE01021358.1.p1 GENE.GGOE01021358.1~~GGOE01021358.1.p1  ORF type:complete len:387 (+),score=130.72 GGOE01021358.1:96-1256(+)
MDDAFWQKTKSFWSSASNVAATSSSALSDTAAVMMRRLQGEAAARPSWTVGFEAAVTALRVAIKTVARDVATIRLLTDNSLPRGLLPSGVSFEDAVVGDGLPSAEWLWPTGSPAPYRAIVFLHGGAFATCCSSTHRSILFHLVLATGASVLAVNYRRPPEDPFPAPLEDAAAAYQWLLTRVPPQRIMLVGDSAGAGLCLTLLVALRDASRPLPRAAVLISPWVELRDTTRDSWIRNAPYDFIDAEMAQFFANIYAAGQNMDHPKLSPINADLRGLPPLHIEVGECEVLLDQVLVLANRAQRSGVDVRLVLAEDMPHVFPLFTFAVPQSDGGRTPEPFRAFERIGHFMDEMIPLPTSSATSRSAFIDLGFEEFGGWVPSNHASGLDG